MNGCIKTRQSLGTPLLLGVVILASAMPAAAQAQNERPPATKGPLESHPEALKAIDGQVKAVATEAAEFAQQNPEPDPGELYTDILR